MTVDVASFKTAFPEFAAASDAQISIWLDQAIVNLNPQVFGARLDTAIMLWTAHYLSISMRNARSVAGGGSGGVPGASFGPLTSKSVGPVSVGYSAGLVMNARAGQWNMTTYGQQFYDMLVAASAGSLYVPPARARQIGWPPNRLLGDPGRGRGPW